MAFTSLTAGAETNKTLRERFADNTRRMSMLQNPNAPKTLWAADNAALQGLRRNAKAMPARIAQQKPIESISKMPGYGFIQGPNGAYWVYTQTFEQDSTTNFYTGSTITLYDDKHEKKGDVKISIPKGKKVNYIEPYGQITKKFFDKDESTHELLVYVHEIGENYSSVDSIYAYNTKGELVQRFHGDVSLQFECNKNEWTTYERFILVRDTLMAKGDTLISHSKIEVYKPGGWGATNAVVDHTFYLDNRLWNYSEGPYVNTYAINGEPYYTLSYYEKEYDTNQDNHTGDFEIIPAENNRYVVDIYDRNYKLVKTVKVPVEKSDNATYRFASMGMFDNDDLSIGKFTEDDDFNVVISFSDYQPAMDGYLYSYEVYNGSSEKVRTIAADVFAFKRLADINGKERQYFFMHIDEDAGEYLDLINVPSCQKELTFPALIDEEVISTTMDRYAKDGSYQYAVFLSTADQNQETGEIYGQIGWYTRKLETDHIVKFPLTTEGLYMSPLLTHVSLNPYLFDTDEDHEYIYLANIYKSADSDEVGTHLFVADGDGTVMRQYSMDETKGKIYNVAIVNENTDNACLTIAYMNDDTYEYHMDFIPLPFEKFKAGGVGTKENPYLVSTMGDLMQINNDPNAHYVQVNDINMNSYNDTWTPINNFGGDYDGAGYKIKNMAINGTGHYYSGLFANLEAESKVANITFQDPVINVTDDNGYVGVLAGSAIAADIRSIHVEGYPEITTDSEAAPVIGGVVGTVALESNISLSSVSNLYVSVPNAEMVGGIAGESKTSTVITSCYADGDIAAGEVIGGIAGFTGAGSTVTNCHADFNLEGKSVIGGIVGENNGRALVGNNIAAGTITATGGNKFWGSQVGGIVGSLAADWSTVKNGTMVADSTVADIIVGNFVDITTITTALTSETSANGIVGYSIENETDDRSPALKLKELALAKNYIAGGMEINGNEQNQSGSHNAVTGETKATADADKTFFESLGFAYGDNKSAPWTESTGYIPVLFFKNNHALGISEAEVPAAVNNGNGKTYNLRGMQVNPNAKGLIIRNGKIIFVK